MSQPSNYLFQVVPLLFKCKKNLRLALSQTKIRISPGRYESLNQLQKSLVATEKLLFAYVFEKLHEERDTKGNSNNDEIGIVRALEILKQISHLKSNNNHRDESRHNNHRHSNLRNPQEPRTLKSRSLYTTNRQSADSQLLFRLIVICQLLLVRIDDAHYVISGHRIIPDAAEENEKNNETHNKKSQQVHYNLLSFGCYCCLGAGLITGYFGRSSTGNHRIKLLSLSSCDKKQLILATSKASASLLSLTLLKNFLNVCWMTDKIIRSNNELLEWNHQWELIHYSPEESNTEHSRHYSSLSAFQSNALSHVKCKTSEDIIMEDSLGIDDDKSRKLIEYAKVHGDKKSYFWSSTGEIRFLMIKRFMDIYYASVGVGVHCTKQTSPLFLPLVTGAAASFYTITGAPTPTVVNESSRDLIQHAWGMVSLPALKNLMLQASKLVKGAAVADRIHICGVPCFILSKDPAPELASLLNRKTKRKRRDSVSNLSQLSTIAETETHSHAEEANFGRKRKSFVGSKGKYRQRDIILHLTGGGFFAHTIASDLPYLLDWSSSTGAVVICPEYSLLPEHHFPTQLNQIAIIYAALASGNTGPELGFDVNSIIVTGESAGGNLAAALCVKLAMHNIGVGPEDVDIDDTSSSSSSSSSSPILIDDNAEKLHRMPDAIMLSCPALNLTTELSHSRVVGTEDPVLPNALISAISDAYLPPGFDKKDPLASPHYAPDSVLRRFPPALLFASSKDPLLDDSVTFNERLSVLGVDSELIAVNNVPHAYLGLGTAGFPEAVQVQKYAVDWLSSKLR